jgi:cytochrome c
MKRALMIFAAAATSAMTMPAMATEALARANACMACHAIDRKMVGPSFRDISARYAGNADAVARMVTKIQRGGSGSWGAVPMPANPRISDADARTLAAWSLSHR